MKKGFTLVELLAVIVILSIIGMITVPMAISYVEKSKIESYEISVNNAIEAAKEYVGKTEENNDFPKGGIDLKKVDLNLKNEKFQNGIIKRNEEGIIEAENVYNGTYCASGTKNNIVVKKVKSYEECSGIDVTPPEVKLKVNHKDTRSITVVALASDSISEIKSYTYCIGEECYENVTKNYYTFEGLTPGKEYTITVTVKNENSGKEGYSKDITDTTVSTKVKTESIEKAEFKVSTSNFAGEKEVTIIYPEGKYQYYYEIKGIDGSIQKEKEQVEGTTTIKVTKNCIITAYVDEVASELYVVGIDQEGPEVIVIMKENWEKTKQIEIEAKDDAGIATKGYSYDGGKNWTSNTKRTYQKNQKIKLVVRDKLGNLTTKYKICTDKTYQNCYEAEEIVIGKIDTVPPTCSLEVKKGIVGTNNWYISDVEIGFKEIQDTAIGVDGTVVSGSGIKEQKISQPKLTKDGKYTIKGTVTDIAGNVGTCQIKVNVDKTSPSVPTSEIRYNNSTGEVRGSINQWTNQTLWWGNFNSSDNLSGIDHYEYSTGCTGEKSGNLGQDYTYNKTTNYNFCIRSVDKSGNVSDWSKPNYIKVDKTAPSVPTSEIRYNSSTGTLKGNSNSFTNQTLWWGNFSSTDSESGIDHYEYSTGCTGTKSGNLDTRGYTYPSDVNYAFCIRSIDKMGNISGWSSPYYIKVDKTPPTIGISLSGTPYGSGYLSGLRVNIQCSDNLSGVASNTGSNNLYNAGWNSVTGVCKDAAGNQSTTSGSYLIYVYTPSSVCGYATCSTSACGVASVNYKYCQNAACGTETYASGTYACNPYNCNAYSCNCRMVNTSCSNYGCYLYKSCSTAACGCRSYRTEEYTASRWQTNTVCRQNCGGGRCGGARAAECIKTRSVCSGYNTCQSSACGSEYVTGSRCNNAGSKSCISYNQQQVCDTCYQTCYQTCTSYSTRNKSCRTSACGVESYNYNTCQSSACGYATCWHT